MPDDNKPAGGKKALENITSVVTNKRSRSFIFLVVTFVLILVANGLMPLISGQAHYTANPIDLTYAEYLVLKEADPLNDLTYGAKLKIELYKELYILDNRQLTPEEQMLVEPPDSLIVSVYTEFFFESEWWYFQTGISLFSAIFLFYALFNYLVVRSKDTHIDHINGEASIRQLNEKYLDPDTFEPWVDDSFNRERKIKQHTRNIRFALKQLELKTPYVIRKKFKTYFDPPKTVVATTPNVVTTVAAVVVPKGGKEKRYISQKEDLLSQLEPEYIQSSVIDNTVKNFREIKPGFVYSGINSEGVGQDEYSTIQTDQQRVRGSMMSKIVMSLATTLSFASVLTVLAVNVEDQDPMWLFISVLTKIVPLLLQVYFAIDYDNWFMEHQLLPNLQFRFNIGMLYLAEMKRRGILTEPIVINKLTVQPKGKERGK